MSRRDKRLDVVDKLDSPNNGCICPEKCFINKPIDTAKPGDAQKMTCSNSKCTQTLFIHKVCFEKFEESLVHMMLKARLTRGRDWTAEIWHHNLWLKKGYEVIIPHCKCPCGGNLRKDVDYMPPMPVAAAAPESGAKPKHHKSKQNQLPKLVVNPSYRSSLKKVFPMGEYSTAGSYSHNTRYDATPVQCVENLPPRFRSFSNVDYFDDAASENEPSVHSTRSAWTKNPTPTFIVKNIDSESDLIEALVELIKSNGQALLSKDARVLSLFDHASPNVITLIFDSYGDILKWAQMQTRFNVYNDLINLAQVEPWPSERVQRAEKVLSTNLHIPKSSPLKGTAKKVASGEQGGWQVAGGRRGPKSNSFSYFDNLHSNSFESESTECFEYCATSPVPNEPKEETTLINEESDVTEEYYQAASSPDSSIKAQSTNTSEDYVSKKMQELYGHFLEDCSSMDMAYSYGRLEKETQKMRDMVEKMK